MQAICVGVVATVVAMAAGGVAGCGTAPVARIRWDAPFEIAAGGGERGPWQQNDSRYDHVDDPSVAFDARGALVVAWVDHRPKDVLVQVYDRAGRARHAQPINVSRTPAIFSWLPRVVVSPEGGVFVLWQEIIFSGGSHGGDILFARSLDGGARFEPAQNLSRSIGGDGKARVDREHWLNGSLDLAIGDDGALYAAWTEYDGQLWFARSRDRGASFAPAVALPVDAGRPARAPALAVTPSVVYLAWSSGEGGASDVRIAASRDRGATFEPAAVVHATGTADAPKLAVDARGVVHLVHAESAGAAVERYRVGYARSRDGRTFEPVRRISGAEPAAFPSIALDERGGVHVLWESYPDRREPPRGLAIASSSNGGDSFGAPQLVPGTIDPAGGGNGSFQGRLMRKLAARGEAIAVVNSSLALGRGSRVWVVRGALGR